MEYIQRLSDLINQLFNNKQNDSLFIIAGRNATVGYSELFEQYLLNNLRNVLEQNRKQAFEKTGQTVDETLMLAFVERVFKNKGIFKKYQSFSGLINTQKDEDNRLIIAEQIIKDILKGEYVIDQWGEKIKIDNNNFVYLQNASSGQQEIIRILQDIFLVILDKQKVLRIIEEPEAHLFPVAQKQVIELLSMMVNANEQNQLIITTHSPYILTVINNLLFASRIISKNGNAKEEVNKIIKEEFYINPSEFSAYSLGNSLLGGKYCEDIFNPQTGLIRESYLDLVSDILGTDFNRLYNIHALQFSKS